MPETKYDVLIVGSGASGGMAAYTLTKKGIKCLMLDAGPPIDFERQRVNKAAHELPFRGFGKPGKLSHVFQATEFNANQWVDETQVPYTHDPKEPYNWVRVRMIGGKSLFWARMSFRFSDYEFKAKDHDGYGDNWPISYSDLAPYYDQVEPIFRVRGRRDKAFVTYSSFPTAFLSKTLPARANATNVLSRRRGSEAFPTPRCGPPWAAGSSPARSTFCCRMPWPPGT